MSSDSNNSQSSTFSLSLLDTLLHSLASAENSVQSLVRLLSNQSVHGSSTDSNSSTADNNLQMLLHSLDLSIRLLHENILHSELLSLIPCISAYKSFDMPARLATGCGREHIDQRVIRRSIPPGSATQHQCVHHCRSLPTSSVRHTCTQKHHTGTQIHASHKKSDRALMSSEGTKHHCEPLDSLLRETILTQTILTHSRNIGSSGLHRYGDSSNQRPVSSNRPSSRADSDEDDGVVVVIHPIHLLPYRRRNTSTRDCL